MTPQYIGIAVGSMGSSAAIEDVYIVITDDNTRKIASTVRIARKTMNIVFTLSVKAVVMIPGALGLANR